MRPKILVVIAFCLCLPFAVRANPYIFNPSSAVAFVVVSFWAFVVETGVVTLLLAFRGVAPIRTFLAYFVANALVFFFVFQPLVDRQESSVLGLEVMVVLIDGFVIKVLTSLNAIQGDNFTSVSWWYAVVVSGVGNTMSFFVGYLASREPWAVHSTEGFL